MKTFLILFAIASSLPAEAQRVRENIRQRVEIVDTDSVQEDAKSKQEEREDRKNEQVQKLKDALRKK